MIIDYVVNCWQIKHIYGDRMLRGLQQKDDITENTSQNKKVIKCQKKIQNMSHQDYAH